MPTRIEFQIILGIVISGILLRAIVWWLIPLEPVSDFQRYFDVAKHFAESGELSYQGFKYVIQSPIYPVALGVFFDLFGASTFVGKAFNFVLSCALVVASVLIVRSLPLRRWGRFTIVGITALHPGLILYSNVLGTEILSVLLVTVCIGLALRDQRLWWAGLGACLGLLSLNRAQFIPVVFLFCMLRGGGIHLLAKRSLWLLIPFILVLTPWTVRNYAAFGKFVPSSSNGGYVLFVNNNDFNTTGSWIPLSAIQIPEGEKALFDPDGDGSLFDVSPESDKIMRWTTHDDEVAMKLALKWIKANPSLFMNLAWKRIVNTFNPGALLNWPLHDYPGNRTLELVLATLDIALFGLSVVAIGVICLRRRVVQGVALSSMLILLAGLGAIAVFEGQGRYLLPLVPAASFLVSIAFFGAKPETLRVRTHKVVGAAAGL
jgi:hypothetical protein